MKQIQRHSAVMDSAGVVSDEQVDSEQESARKVARLGRAADLAAGPQPCAQLVSEEKPGWTPPRPNIRMAPSKVTDS